MKMHDSILEMARGAIMERADYDMQAVIENILDVNTEAAKERALTITIKFKPDSNRQTVRMSVISKPKLVETTAVETSLYLTKDESGDICAVEMLPQLPGQMIVEGGKTEERKIFRIGRAVND